MKLAMMSDLHGFLPEIPECDVLIGGDICPDSYKDHGIAAWAKFRPEVQVSWLKDKFIPWLEGGMSKAKHMVGVWGNHDWASQLIPNTIPDLSPLIMLNESKIVLDGVKIWGSPWSNEFCGWAWMKHPQELNEVYNKIPDDVDIIISHQPPYGLGDQCPNGHVGSKELLYKIREVNPELVVCGHIHGGHGQYKYHNIDVWNVSVVDEAYRLVNEAVIWEI